MKAKYCGEHTSVRIITLLIVSLSFLLFQIIQAKILYAAVLTRLGVFPKPLIILGIMDHELQQVPITREKKSDIHNLTYILLAHDFENDLNVFYDIFPFRKLTVIVDKKLAALIPGADEKFKAIAAAKGVECQTAAYDGRIDEVFENFSSASDLYMVLGATL